jgi:hypothetical protein
VCAGSAVAVVMWLGLSQLVLGAGRSSTFAAAACSTMVHMTVTTYLGLSKVDWGMEVQLCGWCTDTTGRKKVVVVVGVAVWGWWWWWWCCWKW